MHQSNSVAKLSRLVSFTICSRFVLVLQLCNRCCTIVTPVFVHVLFYCCKNVTLLQKCHCCKIATDPPRVQIDIMLFVSILGGNFEYLPLCHHWSPLVTIGHHWSPLVTFGHLRLSYTPLTKLQKTCIIILNTTAYAR